MEEDDLIDKNRKSLKKDQAKGRSTLTQGYYNNDGQVTVHLNGFNYLGLSRRRKTKRING